MRHSASPSHNEVLVLWNKLDVSSDDILEKLFKAAAVLLASWPTSSLFSCWWPACCWLSLWQLSFSASVSVKSSVSSKEVTMVDDVIIIILQFGGLIFGTKVVITPLLLPFPTVPAEFPGEWIIFWAILFMVKGCTTATWPEVGEFRLLQLFAVKLTWN